MVCAGINHRPDETIHKRMRVQWWRSTADTTAKRQITTMNKEKDDG